MRSAKLAAVLALLGAVAWLVEVALIWGNGGTNTDGGVAGLCHVVGLVALGLALLAGGYATVANAPIWLRTVVSLATLALGAVVFTALDDAARALHSGGGWLEDEIGILLAAALMLVFGVVVLLRRTPRSAEHEHVGGHHVAR
jgi:hypothetical protein